MKKLGRKLILFLACLALCFGCAFGLSACAMDPSGIQWYLDTWEINGEELYCGEIHQGEYLHSEYITAEFNGGSVMITKNGVAFYGTYTYLENGCTNENRVVVKLDNGTRYQGTCNSYLYGNVLILKNGTERITFTDYDDNPADLYALADILPNTATELTPSPLFSVLLADEKYGLTLTVSDGTTEKQFTDKTLFSTISEKFHRTELYGGISRMSEVTYSSTLTITDVSNGNTELYSIPLPSFYYDENESFFFIREEADGLPYNNYGVSAAEDTIFRYIFESFKADNQA